MTSNKIKSIIKECLYKAVNEGSTDQNLYNYWLNAQEVLGADKMLDAIWNYLSSDQLEQIVEWLNDDYELWDDNVE